MLKNLAIGLPIMAICLIFQALLVAAAFRYYSRHNSRVEDRSLWSSLWMVVGVMMLLVIGNFSQVVTWALVFLGLGEFASLSEAVYHSAVNFATLGYGDIVMSEKHKLLGPLEAINGVLMIGVSTAALMATFQDTFKSRLQSRFSRN